MSDENRSRLLEAARARPGPDTLEAALQAWSRTGRGLDLLERVGDPALGEDPLGAVSRALWRLGLGLGDPRFAHGELEDHLLDPEGRWLATVDEGGVLRRFDLVERRLLHDKRLPEGVHTLLRREAGLLSVSFVSGAPGDVVVDVASLGGEVPAWTATVRGLPEEVGLDGSGIGWVARHADHRLQLLSQLAVRDLPPGTHTLDLPAWAPAPGEVPGQVWFDPSGARLLVEPIHEMEPQARLVELSTGEVEARYPGVVAAAFEARGAALALLRCRFVTQGSRGEIRERYRLEVVDLPAGSTRWEKELDNLPSVSLAPAAWTREVRWGTHDVWVDGIAYGAATGARRKQHAPPPGRRVDAGEGTLWVHVTSPGSRDVDPVREPAFGPRGHRAPISWTHAPATGAEVWTRCRRGVFRAWSWHDGAPRGALDPVPRGLVFSRGGAFGVAAPRAAEAWTVLALPSGSVVGHVEPGADVAEVFGVDLSPDGARLLLALSQERVEVHAVSPVESGAPGRSPGDVLDDWRVADAFGVAWDRSGRVALALSPEEGRARWRDLDRREEFAVGLPGRAHTATWCHDPASAGVLVSVPGQPLVRLLPGEREAEVVIPREVGSGGFRVACDGSRVALVEEGGVVSLWAPGGTRPRERLRDLPGDLDEYVLGPEGTVLRTRGAGLVVVSAEG